MTTDGTPFQNYTEFHEHIKQLNTAAKSLDQNESLKCPHGFGHVYDHWIWSFLARNQVISKTSVNVKRHQTVSSPPPPVGHQEKNDNDTQTSKPSRFIVTQRKTSHLPSIASSSRLDDVFSDPPPPRPAVVPPPSPKEVVTVATQTSPATIVAPALLNDLETMLTQLHTTLMPAVDKINTITTEYQKYVDDSRVLRHDMRIVQQLFHKEGLLLEDVANFYCKQLENYMQVQGQVNQSSQTITTNATISPAPFAATEHIPTTEPIPILPPLVTSKPTKSTHTFKKWCQHYMFFIP